MYRCYHWRGFENDWMRHLTVLLWVVEFRKGLWHILGGETFTGTAFLSVNFRCPPLATCWVRPAVATCVPSFFHPGHTSGSFRIRKDASCLKPMGYHPRAFQFIPIPVYTTPTSAACAVAVHVSLSTLQVECWPKRWKQGITVSPGSWRVCGQTESSVMSSERRRKCPDARVT